MPFECTIKDFLNFMNLKLGTVVPWGTSYIKTQTFNFWWSDFLAFSKKINYFYKFLRKTNAYFHVRFIKKTPIFWEKCKLCKDLYQKVHETVYLYLYAMSSLLICSIHFFTSDQKNEIQYILNNSNNCF